MTTGVMTTHEARLMAAILNIEAEWTAYIGIDDTEGHDDPTPVGAAIAAAMGEVIR